MRKILKLAAGPAAAGLLVLLCSAAFTLAAQDAPAPANVAGTWQLSMQGRNGNTMTQTMTIEQDGANIKGTIKGRRGDQALTGTVSGNDASWTVSFQGRNGNTFNLQYKATVSGDSMKGTLGGGRFSRDFTATRGAAAQK